MQARSETLSVSRVFTRERVIAVAKAIAITLTFAFAYYWICQWTPELSKSSLQGMIFGKTLRLATALKAFVIVTPLAAVGNALGSLAFNLQAGDTVQSFMVYIQIGVGLFFAWISAMWGRSVFKDIAVLGAYGVVNGMIAAAKLTAISMLIANDTWSKFLETAVLWKVSTSAMTLMAGYLAVRAFEAGKAEWDERRAGGK